MNLAIKKTLLSAAELKPLPDITQLKFGHVFTDHMFTMEYDIEHGWHNAEIKPYQPLVLDPAAAVLHYGQEVFEGQKAYRAKDGRILLFRPLENAKRLNRSLDRICMPRIPEEIYLAAECALLQVEQRWIFNDSNAALYIRPFVIATEAFLGVRAAERYLFGIILSPVGPYFGHGLVNLWVSEFYVRAVAGGIGEAKTGGNYAASLLMAKMAKENGYDQVLWLDAKQNRYVEEAGGMNIFFVLENKLVTPKLSSSILAGITRKSVLELVASIGIEAEERDITIDEVLSGIEQHSITEVFVTGTAAVVVGVGKLHYKGKDYIVGNNIGVWTQKIHQLLIGIQRGNIADQYDWVHAIRN